jgi:diguanylate cyclase (GGDEF)-like protein
MQENKLFEVLLDVIPFAAYAVDIETYEVVYANKMMSEKMYAPREEFCWKKVFGQEEVCSWCTIPQLKLKEKVYKSEKLISNFFDESTDSWLQAYDELVSWPDGRTIKYTITVDITEQKEIQATMIQTHTKLAIQTKKLKEANEKLEIISKKDYLTKINNRGNFFALGEDIYNNEQDPTKEIFVAMVDLDKFKSLNDTYGHQLGDEALRNFAQEVEKHLSESDIFGRLGGEEFAVIIQSASSQEVIEKIDTIRESIDKIILIKDNNEIHFTVSVGLVQKEGDETLDMTLEKADRLLYEAKESGRNQVKFRL